MNKMDKLVIELHEGTNTGFAMKILNELKFVAHAQFIQNKEIPAPVIENPLLPADLLDAIIELETPENEEFWIKKQTV